MRFLTLVLVFCGALHAQEPVRIATTGRLWLQVPAEHPPLRNVSVSSGTATSAHWENDPEVRERKTDVSFPIRWWTWGLTTLTFTPSHDGPLDLILSGMWAQEIPGKTVRQEILWDGISAEGAEISNGSFEETADGVPRSWKPLYGPFYVAEGEWPLAGADAPDGSKVAATWHDRPLGQTLQVKAGQPVTLRLHARAATPPDFIAPERLGKDTPAHRAAKMIRRGVNLGNCWEAPPPYTWGIRFAPEDIDHIAAEGFDHIRVPVAWQHYLKPDGEGYEIDPALLADLEPVLRRALEKGLHILVDWHHFEDLNQDPQGNRPRFVKGWETLATHFKDWPDELYLELLNEPNNKLTTEVLNPIQADAIAAIRRIDPDRIIFVSPGDWGKVEELDKLLLPDADDRLVVTIHCYEPFYFTHQQAGWSNLGSLKGVRYPGPPDSPLTLPDELKDNAGLRSFVENYNTLSPDKNPSSAEIVLRLLDSARDWSDHFGRPVHLGEFGSIRFAQREDRIRYSKDVRLAAEARGIPWTLWDWKAMFAYWNSETQMPLIREAFFDH